MPKKDKWAMLSPRQRIDLVNAVSTLRYRACLAGFVAGFLAASMTSGIALSLYLWLR